MRKKGLVVLLIALVSVCSVFAVDMKVGLQMGFGARSFNFSAKGKSEGVVTTLDALIKNKGFYVAGMFSFEVADNIEVVSDIGINTMGKASLKVSTMGVDMEGEDDKSTPVNFTLLLGAMYNLPVSKELKIGLGGGLDMMIGRLISDDGTDDNKNVGIGLGVKTQVSYSITEQISLLAGGRFGWHFINTNTSLKDSFSGEGVTSSQNMISYKFFVGATYSI